MLDIKRKALHGALAKLCGLAANVIIRLSLIAVLARLLAQSDFGLVAMVSVVITFLELFSSAGLSSAAVQRSVVTDEQVSTLFWINVLIGTFLGLLCMAIAPMLAAFFHEPRLVWVTMVMGAAFIFSSAGVQHNAMLQRQMRFGTLAAIEVMSHFTSFGVAVCFAYAGYGYWALVAAAIAVPATMTLSMWIVTAWVPGRPRWDAATSAMLRFGGTVTLNGVAIYIPYNIDKLLIGRVWGAEPLGFYGTAAQLAFVPTGSLSRAIGSVAFSALSRLQHDAARFKRYFLKGYALVTSITLPLALFLGVFAHDVVLVVLGPTWADAIPIFRLLTPTILVLGIIDPLGWLLLASARHVRSLKLALIIAALVVSGCLVGLPYGPKGVSTGFSSAMVLWLVPHVIWCVQGTSISVWDVARTVARPLLAAVLGVLTAHSALFYLGDVQQPFMRVLVAGGITGFVYLATLLFVLGQKSFYIDLFRTLKSASAVAATDAALDSPLTRR